MSERSAVDRIDEPVTRSRLVSSFRDLGIERGETVLVHASLSAIGWTVGGPQAVVDALFETVTRSGTVVMPTHTTQYSDPTAWTDPPVPDEWIETILECRPAYRPSVTPTRSMGAIAECFRTYPGTVRSRHPIYSFAAWGYDAEAIVSDHEFDYGLGDGSPLARVYDLDGKVLMLGTDYRTNTSLHLAEHRADVPLETSTTRVPVLEAGDRVHVEIETLETRTDDFVELGTAFEAQTDVHAGTVGAAEATLLDQRSLVEFARDWFETNR